MLNTLSIGPLTEASDQSCCNTHRASAAPERVRQWLPGPALNAYGPIGQFAHVDLADAGGWN
jgi:hypothetical protein